MTTKVITHQWTTKTYGQGNVDVKNCGIIFVKKYQLSELGWESRGTSFWDFRK
ncbi:hypothetical protein HZP39_00020 [Elizabethkingia anophelis]|uniref:hypothetical protein n=1 Tax=Elizabethkingia TaxID=308865 RepID=UPI001A3196BD|nr:MULTISPECIES: hypothetical protein [Elizabethkingia]MCT3669199.1 hypothetical protein [Elizabethkingia anophelis]MCT3687557.1 hypothetical protein [Elizabethkingia anophelis]MCT3705597.1 hypothetical protein [Elizabethkingia anophelis]MCT3712615.1 hypothetical protein [Elizabethkingia anophelis]MCT3714995.1 hypothetical protein [Elizabethkingia anophelis]